MLGWKCEDCGYKEAANPFITFSSCVSCDSPNFFHGKMLQDDDEIVKFYEKD